MAGLAAKLEDSLGRAIKGVERGVVRMSRAVEGAGVKAAVKVAGEGKFDEDIRMMHGLPDTEHLLYDCSTTAVTDAVFKGRLTLTEGFMNFYSPTKTRPIAVSVPWITINRVDEGYVVFPRVKGQPLSVVHGGNGEPQIDVGEKALPAVLVFTSDNHIHTFTQLASYKMCYNLVRHLWIAGKAIAGTPLPPIQQEPVQAHPIMTAANPAGIDVSDVPVEPTAPPPAYDSAAVVEPVIQPQPEPQAELPAPAPAPVQTPPVVERKDWSTDGAATTATAPAAAATSTIAPVDDLALLSQQMSTGPVQPK